MPRKILIVDDIILNRILLRNILEEDYYIVEAQDGDEALLRLREGTNEFSVVLLDIIMPNKDGFEVIKEMREDKELSQLPIIVMTGDGEEATEVKALSLGANDFVLKPYNAEIIKHRIRNTISLRENAAIVNATKIDALTGLYTRSGFFERAAELIAEKEAGYWVLVCTDIDEFKVINDQFGFKKGDEVLKYIATEMKSTLAEYRGIACRVSADNFALLYPSSLLDSQIIRDLGHRSSHYCGLISPLSVSVGRYIINDLSLSVSAMYDRAAMAKETIKGRFDVRVALYDEKMRDILLRQQKITGEMKSALASKQFEIWFQPQYNHSTGALVGSEALVRWRHPEEGLISPGEFIPVFEKNGFIYELDKFVWEQTCIFLRKQIDLGEEALPVSVNISRSDLMREDLVDFIVKLTEKYRLPVSLLRLEITESAFAKNVETILMVVNSLISCGFTLEIDDFGSGYSSLNTLKDVPAAIVKLDMRFLEGEQNSNRGGNIIQSVVRMTNWLGMSIIAEGVENIEQADFLKSIGCSYVQGYLYARPMPMADYESLLISQRKENKLEILKKIKHFDNEAFWNPKSFETFVFNSFVGGACVFEYYNNEIEMLRANDRFIEIFGVENSELFIGRSIRDYTESGSTEKLIEAANRAIESEKEVSVELVFSGLDKERKKTFVILTMRVIARSGGRFLFYCRASDITAQREAETQTESIKDMLQVILDNVANGILAFALDGERYNRIFVNEKYFDIMGFNPKHSREGEIDYFETIVPEDKERVKTTIDSAAKLNETRILEFEVIRYDGKRASIRADLTIARFTELGFPVQIGILMDNTAEKLKKA